MKKLTLGYEDRILVFLSDPWGPRKINIGGAARSRSLGVWRLIWRERAMILRIPKASSERYAPHAIPTGATALLLPAQTLLFMYVSIGTGKKTPGGAGTHIRDRYGKCIERPCEIT